MYNSTFATITFLIKKKKTITRMGDINTIKHRHSSKIGQIKWLQLVI